MATPEEQARELCPGDKRMEIMATIADMDDAQVDALATWLNNGKEQLGVISKFEAHGARIGRLVKSKNDAYGDSFSKCGDFLKLLYPEGIPIEQYKNALTLVRIFDKQMRIATNANAFGENPFDDIAGYGILGGTLRDTVTQYGLDLARASGSTVPVPAEASLTPRNQNWFIRLSTWLGRVRRWLFGGSK